MPFPGRLLLLCVVALGLSACAGPRETARMADSRHAPRPVIDPDDGVFKAAVDDYLKSHHAPLSSQYEYTREDLNGDGRREAIAMFSSPFYSWCSADGCRVVIFEAFDDHFAVRSEIASMRGPILISDTKTHGWKDLVVRVSGRTDWRAKDVALKFDGQVYPGQPDFQPALPSVIALANINGTEIFP